MATAAQRVFNTVELLEAILLEAARTPSFEDTEHAVLQHDLFNAAKTVIASQRVSKAFHQTIIGSSSLERALCFEQPPNTKSPVWIDHLRLTRDVATGWMEPYRYSPLIIEPVKVEWADAGGDKEVAVTIDFGDGSPKEYCGSWQRLHVVSAGTSITRLRIEMDGFGGGLIYPQYKLRGAKLGELVRRAAEVVEQLKERKVKKWDGVW